MNISISLYIKCWIINIDFFFYNYSFFFRKYWNFFYKKQSLSGVARSGSIIILFFRKYWIFFYKKQSLSGVARSGPSSLLRPFLITHTDYEKTEFCNPKNEKINPYDARITEIIFVIVFSWSSITKKRSILRDRSITKITITKNVEYLSYQSYRSHKLFS